MAQPASTSTPKEKTFSSYNQEQGKKYAELRRDYHPDVYQTIIDHHTSTGGQFDTLLDVGCGPGLAAFALSSQFSNTTGLDPSEGMIATAKSIGSSMSSPIRFEISTAEDLGSNLSPPIPDSSIDLITASNAAHWFDMSGFWPAAARVLKPGGSVALWTSGEIRTHPSMPAAAEIQAVFDQMDEQYLRAFYEPGNVLTRNRYHGLPLPWTLAQPVPEFDETTFLRKDWDVGQQFFVGLPEADLDMFEKMMSTSSPITRWRQANHDKVGTDPDVVRMMRLEMERLLHEAGVEKGKEKIKGAVHGVVLIVKKKAE